ncbi:hypothetical protein [Synechococcus sp. PCC 7336]|uniref:hypothetical protein n=1 Tax=Synechococcus sp. PCC 7336 TaxID=195250 RepID=UPI000349EBB9|nr:hypothetical protein [Synechococcus sp. PCC 7336]
MESATEGLTSMETGDRPRGATSFSATRWLLHALSMLSGPVILFALAQWHPFLLGPNMFLSTLPLANESIAFHLLQLWGLGFVAIAAMQLVRGLSGTAAQLSRIGCLVFWGMVLALDPTVPVLAATLGRNLQGLPADPEALMDVASLLPLDAFGTIAHPNTVAAIVWLLTAVAAAIALRQAGRSWLVSLCLIGSGLLFGFGHPPLSRGIGLACFAIACVWGEVERWRSPALTEAQPLAGKPREGEVSPDDGA